MRWRPVAGLLVILAAGCTEPEDRVCTPGETQVCVGPGACSGAQVCSDDGARWDACVCGGPTDGGTIPSGGSSGDAGAASSGGTVGTAGAAGMMSSAGAANLIEGGFPPREGPLTLVAEFELGEVHEYRYSNDNLACQSGGTFVAFCPDGMCVMGSPQPGAFGIYVPSALAIPAAGEYRRDETHMELAYYVGGRQLFAHSTDMVNLTVQELDTSGTLEFHLKGDFEDAEGTIPVEIWVSGRCK